MLIYNDNLFEIPSLTISGQQETYVLYNERTKITRSAYDLASRKRNISHQNNNNVAKYSFSCHIQTMLLKDVFSNIISMIRHKRASDKYIY